MTITAQFSEPLATIPEISIDQPGSLDILPTSMQGSGSTWTYRYTVTCADGGSHVDGTATVSIANGFDTAGNENATAQNNTFSIDTSACGSGNIIAAEYYFDTDPGEGNGISLPATDGQFDSTEESVSLTGIDISDLTLSRHTAFVRFKNDVGQWGIARPIAGDLHFTNPYNFSVTGDVWIAGAEYFIDTDPGEGSGVAVDAADGQFDSAEEQLALDDIDVSALPPGQHQLYLRVRDSQDRWGVIREVPFEIYTPVTIAGAEYFIDTDPGPGNGIALDPADGSFDSSEESVDLSGIDTSALSEGIHTLSVRFMDQFGRWGSAQSQYFETGDPSTDTDNDGMPDSWEALYPGLNPNLDDADGDLDGDGLSNLYEYTNGTDPTNPDTDGDGISDGDEFNTGMDPTTSTVADIQFSGVDGAFRPCSGDSIPVLIRNQVYKAYDFEVTAEIEGLDMPYSFEVLNDKLWEPVTPDNVQIAYGRTKQFRVSTPCDCLLDGESFTLNISALVKGSIQPTQRSATVRIDTTPRVMPLTFDADALRYRKAAGNQIFVSWLTDVETTGQVFYKKIDEENFTTLASPIGREHRVVIDNLEWEATYYWYTRSEAASCSSGVETKPIYTTIGQAVAFLGDYEFDIDRLYNQRKTLTITNHDLDGAHEVLLTAVNPYDDLIVEFVDEGSSDQSLTLGPGETRSVVLAVHAQDATEQRYLLGVQVTSDPDSDLTFVDTATVVLNVPSEQYVLNLELEETHKDIFGFKNYYRVTNHGHLLTDLVVYVNDAAQPFVTVNSSSSHALLGSGDWFEFSLSSLEYVTGKVYVGSKNIPHSDESLDFELGCANGLEPRTVVVPNPTIVSRVADWYCVNRPVIEIPMTFPGGFDLANIQQAAIDVRFDPIQIPETITLTIDLLINGQKIGSIDNALPSGTYSFAVPAAYLMASKLYPATNILTLSTTGLNPGNYIAATDFELVLELDQIEISRCIFPPIDRPPFIILPDNICAVDGEVVTFDVVAVDPDGGAVSLSASGMPVGADFSGASSDYFAVSAFNWTVPTEIVGTVNRITFTATDEDGMTDVEWIDISIKDICDDHTLILSPIGDKVVKAGNLLQFTVSATDSLGHAISYSSPTGDSRFTDHGDGTGTFSWTPEVADIGVSEVRFEATDGDLSDSERISIRVIDVINHAPEIDFIGIQHVQPDEALSFTVRAQDPDGDNIAVLEAPGLDMQAPGATFASIGGGSAVEQTFTWTPTQDQTGIYYVSFSATDDRSPPLTGYGTAIVIVGGGGIPSCPTIIDIETYMQVDGDEKNTKVMRPGRLVRVEATIYNPTKENADITATLQLQNNSYQPVSNILIGPEQINLLATPTTRQPRKISWFYEVPADANDFDYEASINMLINSGACSGSSTDYYRSFNVKTPIIIVPGVMSSTLVDGNDELWLDLASMYLSQSDSYLYQLALDENGNSINPNIRAQEVIKHPAQLPFFKQLYNISNLAGYFMGMERRLSEYQGPEPSFFYFPYDWRLDLSITADHLHNKINEVLALTGATRVNVIAHSLGGMLGKRYIMMNSGSHQVKNFIQIGTPNLGALKIFFPLRYGMIDFPLLDQYIYDPVLDGDDCYDDDGNSKPCGISRNFPPVYQLAPSEEFFQHYEGGYYEKIQPDGTIETYETYEEMYGFLTSLRDPGTPEETLFNSSMAEAGKAFQESVNQWNLEDYSLRAFMIAGCGLPTPHKISEYAGSEAHHVWRDDTGDGLTLLKSAVEEELTGKYLIKNGVHSNLPSNSESLSVIELIIEGKEETFTPSSSVATYDESTSSVEFCDYKWVDIQGIWIDIIGPDDQIFSDGVHYYVPDNGLYTIIIDGSSERQNLKISLLQNGGYSKTFVFHDFDIPIGGLGKVQISADLINLLMNIDTDGDGTFDNQILPIVLPDPDASNDIMPPVTTIDIEGTLGTDDWYVSDVTVTLSATDTGGSGLLATRYQFADDATFTDYNAPLQITAPGNHTLHYYSIDRNLNKEITHIITIQIEDHSPPQIVSIIPPDQAVDVIPNTPLQITFSQAMDTSLIDATTLTISGSMVGGYVGQYSFDTATNTLSFTPDQDYLLGEEISVNLSGSLTDLAGIGLDGNSNGVSEGSPLDDYFWSFFITEMNGLNVQVANIDTSDCPLVTATVMVTDEAGTVVPDLTEADFSVYDNNQLRSDISVDFVDQSASPVSVSLALDYSGSMSATAISDMEDAAVEFVGAMGEADEGQIVKFANGVEVAQAYTTEKTDLTGAIFAATSLSTSATHLYDAIYQAITDTAARAGRKAVIVMTDGRDTGSTHSDIEAINHSAANGVSVFTIGLGDSINASILQAIADQTGGVYYEAPDSNDLQAIYQAISDVLKNQYVVTFTPEIYDGQTHTLYIVVTNGALAGSDTLDFSSCGTCVSDFNADADVDGLDLAAFMDAYNEMRLDADLNADGVVNGGDMVVFSGEYGRINCR